MNRCAYSKPWDSCGNRRGVALVVILAFLVLLSGVVLAYFARAISERQVSNSSASQTKAEILAQGALDQIVGDLKQEIADGSTPTTVGEITTYTPNSPAYMVPQLAGSTGTGGMENLVKRSASGVAFSTGGASRASGISSTASSQNGRSITPARWNKPLLLPKSDQSTNNDVDWTPVGATAASWASAPDWIYVARDGSNPTSWNTNLISTGLNSTAVVGRFAYMIYDESGLLDMNVAGYPSKSTPIQSGGKTGLAYADLTQLTDSSGAQLLSSSQIDNIVGWRNSASASTDWTKTPPVLSSPALSGFPGSGTAGWTNAPASVTNYFNYTLKNKNGYLITENPLLNNGQSDRLFASRQELMRLLLGNIASQAASAAGKGERAKIQNALQYLTTFSRAVTTPTWCPSATISSPVGNNVDYAGQADLSNSVNRNLFKLRYPNAANITHYKDDGTTELLALQAGDQMVQRRFSLAKLAWLGHDGPNSAAFAPSVTAAQQAVAIKACFGLTWHPSTGGGSSNARWDYNHGDVNSILTLEQVRNAGREPDFFELLKAGILSGSLGGEPGPVNIPPSSWGPEGLRFDDFSKSKDRHILQIGANIIDQSDSDNYPTAIHQMLVQRPEYGELELFNTVFGDENLPMLSRMTAVSYKLDDSTKAPGIENVWMQPEVWNPHDSSTAGASTSDPNYPTPSTLRLVTYGGCRVELTEGSHLPKPYKDVDFGSSPTNPDPEGIICFKNPKPTSVDPTPAFFDSPVALSGYGTSSFYKYNYQDTSSPSGSKNRYYYGVGAAPNAPASKPRFLGVWLGGLDRDATTYNGAHSISVNPTSSPGEPHLTFVLEYYDGAGFRPYSMMARLNEIDQPNVNTGAPEYSAVGYSSTSWAGTLGWCQFNSGHPDPRTDRFSASGGGVDRAGNHTYPWNAGNSIRASDQVGNVQDGRGGIRVCVPKNSTNAFTYTNPPVAGYYLVDDWSQNLALNDGKPHCVYADPDGVTRPGDSWRGDFSTGATGDGVMLYNLTKTTTGSDFAVSNPRRRPVILNRPFRTVAELGYVFRDQPFKTLDFWSDKSADAGLLDIFSVRDEPTVVAGRVNPSTAPAPVLQAIIAGTLQNSPSNPVVTISPADSGTAAAAMANYFSSSNPLSGPADLVNLSNPTYTALAATKSFSNKSYGEGALRALSSVTNTRTWNLLIDVIAQSGVFPPNATNLGSSFIVQGERRYWLHVAIDRFTGKVIDLQLESVYE